MIQPKATYLGLVVFAIVARQPLAFGEGKEQVAIAAFDLRGDDIEPFRSGYEKDLLGGLSVGFDVLPSFEVEHARHTVPSTACPTEVCLVQLGKTLGVRYLVRASLERVGTSGYPISVELIDAQDGRVIAKSGDPCDVCTTAESHSTLSNVAANLKVEFLKSRPAATATSSAATPALATTVTVAPKQERHSLRALSIASWVTGGILIGGGIGLLAADGSNAGYVTSSDYQIHVRRFDGTPGGAALVAVGGAVVVAGVVLWVLDGRRQH